MIVPNAPWRVHHVICELDARGEIDHYAAMCLRNAIDDAHPATTEVVRVDLRDLVAIDAAALKLLAGLTAGCHARGMDIALLIGDDAPHERVAEALVLAGLGDTVQFTCHAAPARPVGLIDHARGVPSRRLARAVRRYAARRGRHVRSS